MKKTSMALLLGLGIFLTGCQQGNTDQNKNTSTPAGVEATTTSEALSETTSKAGITFSDIHAKPELLKDYVKADLDFKALVASEEYVSTYYMNEVYKETDTHYTQYIFPIPSEEESSALYLNFENDVLKDAKVDEFAGSVSHADRKSDYAITHFGYNLKLQPKQADYKYDYNDLKAIEKDLTEKFVGKEESKLAEHFKVSAPATVMENLKTGKVNDVYLLVNEIGYTTSVSLNVVVEQGKITKIHVDDIGNRTFDPISLIK